jgi:protein-S-isoprenylcysteine O-methyltransferase Ste14
VKEQSVGMRGHGVQDFPPQTEDGHESAQVVYAHAQIDHDEIRVLGKIGCLATDGMIHWPWVLTLRAVPGSRFVSLLPNFGRPGNLEVEVMNQLYRKTLFRLGAVVVSMAVLLFVPADTIRYWQGWVYLAIFAGASLLTSLYLLKKDPALLERRMRGGPTAEKEAAQKVIMLFASLGFIALLVVPALDHRFGWSAVPPSVVVVGDVLVAVGFYFIFLVYRENTFASATIEVAENQRVVSSGPYAWVRHPMYATALLYLIGMPIALGSYWGLLAFLFTLPSLIWRLLDEEKFLAKNLPGYREYQEKVRHRLVPYLW